MRLVWTLFLLCWCISGTAQDQEIRHQHTDRDTPKMVIFPDATPVSQKKDNEIALAYLQKHWETYGLAKSANNVSLKTVRESLLGHHVAFVQLLNGIPIEGAEIIVSVDHMGSVYRVYNNTFPKADAPLPVTKALMDTEAAMEMGWEHLSVTGELKGMPNAELCYLAQDGVFKLVYRVQLQVDDPLGDWRMAVDALDGTVHHTVNRHIYHKDGHAEPSPQTPPRYDGRITDFTGEWERYRETAREIRREKTFKLAKRAEGMGTIFDPDPRTTLLDDSIQDNSPASAFVGSYVQQPLRDITVESGTYRLTGPYVQMVNLSPPNLDPSTTTDGNWNFERGNFGFNEATTYFHIDQSQRELQAMGFVGTRGLQEAPIRVDVNALNGQDNSLFSSPNELWFGAGCVDDSEDADVILHEYGHAIQYAINPSFFGQGHEGAMGEGFGDYWASSYSISRPNGHDFFPSLMFTWDGQFDCWNGRRTDKFDISYNNSRARYDAHEPITGGISDELWSTPLFQSLLELYRQGIPRAQVDQVILEAQFGLGINQTMRLVADATVQAAEMLYPNGPHGQVFREFFANHGILNAETAFSYVAAHVPPNRSETDWKSEIQLSNPNMVTANVTATIYEDGTNGFAQLSQESITIEAGKTATFIPAGSAQRWVNFESDQPIAGTSFFSRRPNDELGTEQAGVPLLSHTERASELILPHVPADRVNFWSGAVLLNPGDTTIDLTVQLIGTNGNDVSNLLNEGVPTQLAPRQKWVTFISEGPGGVPGIFDDSDSGEKVSYVVLKGNGNDLGAFELFGYNSNSGAVATSGIVALPDQKRTVYPVRIATTDSDFSSFSVLNPLDNDVTATVMVYGQDNMLLESKSYTFPGKAKLLGLNLKDSDFTFPLGNGDPILMAGNNVAWMTIQADSPLRIFELSGDNGRTTLDGAAVLGSTTRVAFQNPKGKLQIFQSKHPGTVTISTLKAGEDTPITTTQNLKAGESVTLDVAADTTSLEVTGWLFTANVIDNDTTTGALTIVKGKQIEMSQNQGKFSPVSNDDHGNTFAAATPIQINQTASGRLDFDGDVDFFRVEVPSAGSLDVFTTGRTDTIGTLLDGDMREIATNDDEVAGNLNFRVTTAVTPGTYYINVRGFQSTTGPYELNVNLAASKAGSVSLKAAPVFQFKSGGVKAKVEK